MFRFRIFAFSTAAVLLTLSIGCESEVSFQGDDFAKANQEKKRSANLEPEELQPEALTGKTEKPTPTVPQDMKTVPSDPTEILEELPTEMIAAKIQGNLSTVATDQQSVGKPLPSVNINAPFAQYYQAFDLGQPKGMQGVYGGLTLKRGHPDRMLIACRNLQGHPTLFEVGVIRGSGGHIIDFVDDANPLFTFNSTIDGGLSYAPDGTLYAVQFNPGLLYQLDLRGEEVSARTFSLPDNASGGAISFFTGSGGQSHFGYFIAWGGTRPGGFYKVAMSNGDWATGTPSFTYQGFNLAGGPEGFAYVPAGSDGFNQASMLVAEWSAGQISSYLVNSEGIPSPSSRSVLATNLSGAEGAFFDPSTGDFLFSTWGGLNRFVSIRGFNAPEAIHLKNLRVYLDLNKDGQWQSDEPFVFTDEQGRYEFEDVEEGSYHVRVQVPNSAQVFEPKNGYHQVDVGNSNSISGYGFVIRPVGH